MRNEELPGLRRLMHVCQRLELGLETKAPGQQPPAEGALVGGYPLDPLLAAFYAQWGGAMFATRSASMGLYLVNDETNELSEKNSWWQATWQKRLRRPLFIFGGEAGLSSYYATVPELADGTGHQPVVVVEAGLEAYALPLASTVDRFFDTYSSYLEELVATPGYTEEQEVALLFPWDVPHLLARDERLVELVRNGHFDPLLPSPSDASVKSLMRQILTAAQR